ncbi:hypothetical protein RUM43_012470 [Polyplax serrata]|uniref:EGF-like domain-containing protein n=1 Tax=Polyplax serrata TaxID=468196 RepID=A0AAN8PDP4_POLSC
MDKTEKRVGGHSPGGDREEKKHCWGSARKTRETKKRTPRKKRNKILFRKMQIERREPDTAVYQVNRSGHDHCDVNDGTLLDMTPLTVEGNKLITLYDKDLTEGINLLIVVSQLWGSQCIRLKVTVKSDNCGENADCSNKGICFSNASMEGFECQCCQGYIGPHCEEKDACYPSPCKSNSICVDLSQGHDGETFQCLCPYGEGRNVNVGYKGKTCEERTDPCESSPCENGGKCSTNQTEFHCECPTGYAGERCQHPSELCSEGPCKNGICVPQPESGYKCFCRPGFAGENCEYEFNECESSPCLNGGTCIDQIGGYQCLCGRGYNGKRCHIKVDLCDPEPCPEGRICEDRGNNYSCECPKGYSGPQCNEPLKAVCSSNPCKHGGTCWSSVNSFYCACRPGYSGKTCSQQVPVEEAEMNDKPEGEEFDGQNVALSLRLDKLHNAYIAVGTLACALFIVTLTVAICHCRVHETYKKCFLNSTPLLPCKIRKLDILPKHSRTVKPLLGYPKDQTPMPARSFPTLDTTDVYYTLDFSDNQNAPLIQ